MPGAVTQKLNGHGAMAWLEFVRREPAKVLAAILVIHLVVWTVLPILVCANLQLDLVEDLALGKEWQLGYWKHPPLPWWLADLAYRIVGQVEVVYVLGPLAIVATLYTVWLLAREVAGPLEALIAVGVLEGIHFYNFSAVKFSHDQVQLPFWALTGLFVYRAMIKARSCDWLVAGVMLALCFWSKYAAIVLAASIGLFLLFDPLARRVWRTPGPYLMALAFAVAIAPNAWWLVETGFLPFRYVEARAGIAAHWYDLIVFPLHWIAGALLSLIPAIGLLVLLYWGRKPAPTSIRDEHAAFARRYVSMLAIGPFAVTTLVALLSGRLPVTMWAYPFWSFAPLAVLLWLGPAADDRRLRAFGIGFITLFVAWPLMYIAVELFEPLVRNRPKATNFPGKLLAETVTRAFREKTGAPLVYIGGEEFLSNNVAVYSSDRPHVMVHGNPALSPWIDLDDLRRRGAVFIWYAHEVEKPPKEPPLEGVFAEAEIQPPLVLQRLMRGAGLKDYIGYAILTPRP